MTLSSVSTNAGAESANHKALLRQAYEGEIIGEAMYVRLEGLAEDERQRRACRLLAELEQVTGDVLLPAVTRHGVAVDRDAAWAEGEEYTRRAAVDGWVAYFKGVAPLAEQALAGMRRLHAMSDEQDRDATARLVAHEEAFMEFVRLELAGSPDSLDPLERFLEDERLRSQSS